MNISNHDPLINLETGAYPVYLPQVRQDNINKSFAASPSEELVAELGYAYVWSTDQPAGDVVVETPPIFKQGKWEQQWLARDFTAAERQANFVQTKENCLVRIRELQQNCLERGCRYTFPDNWVGRIQLRDGDRANLAGLRLRAESAKRTGSTETFGFRTYENITKMGLSADQIVLLSDIAFERYMTILGLCWYLKDQAEAALEDAALPQVPSNLDAYGI